MATDTSKADVPGLLLFSGANDRAVLALCRGAARHQIPFALIGRGKDDLLLQSAYAANFVSTRTSAHLDVADIDAAILAARKRYGRQRWVLCPTSEYLNLHLFKHQQYLEANDVALAVCSPVLYQKVSDKLKFRRYCAEMGLAVPQLLESSAVTTLPLPFVAKPAQNLSKQDRILYPYLVRCEKERRRFLEDPASHDYYLERFITGDNWYLLYYFSSNGTYRAGTQRNYLQQGRGKSIVLGRTEPFPQPDVADKIAKRLQSDRYRGFIIIELRVNGHDVSVIEANPRCWGPLQLTVDANMGLLEAFFRDYGHAVELPVPAKRPVSYLWLGGIGQASRKKIGLSKHVSWMRLIGALARAAKSDIYKRPDSRRCFKPDFLAL